MKMACSAGLLVLLLMSVCLASVPVCACSICGSALSKLAAMWGRTPEEMDQSALVGTVDQIRSRMDEFIKVGVTHFIVGASAPFDHPGLRRFAEEIIPKYK